MGDDKCPSCGEWTYSAWRRFRGHYNDGTSMDYCECHYNESAAERDYPCREVDLELLRARAEVRAAQAEVAWDLGVSLPAGHPFAPVVDGKHAA